MCSTSHGGKLTYLTSRTLRHVAQYSPLISEHVKRQIATSPPQPPIKERFAREQLPLSELSLFLNKTHTLNVPVYTVWGACEDVQVLEKLRSGEYKIDNLHIIDEAHSRLLDIGGVKLRLLGLGGAVVMHKLFDNGEGRTTIAGGQGTMWTTLLQMGELVDTATRVYDPTETRIFVTHASPAREGLLNQLSVTLKADFSISAGLHFRYGSSYNEFSVNPTLDHYRGKLAASKASFNDVWETVKAEVEPAVSQNDSQQRLLDYALEIVNKMPTVANGGNPFGGQTNTPGIGQVDESAFKNMWNFNLADAAFGWLVLDIDNGRIGTEMRAQGFNFAHRSGKVGPQQHQTVSQGPLAPQAPVTTSSAGVSPAAQPAVIRSHIPPAAVPQQPKTATGPASAPTPPAAQQQQPRVPYSRAGGPSPAPAASGAPPPAVPVKSATPQPSSVAGGQASGSAASAPSKAEGTEPKTNGTTGTDKNADASKGEPADQKPSTALFVRNAKDEDEVRGLISEDDRPKIQRVEAKHNHFVVHFESHEVMTAVLKRVPREYKGNAPNQPQVKVYQERTSRPPYSSGAGPWASGRGGAQATAGYRSGGASDSEGGNRGGRGGFRGGRGSTRGGERGRGRGGRGGGKAGDSAASSPAPSTPAAATAGGDS